MTMIVVLVGAPGSGKGTQSKVLCGKFGVAHLSTGDMLRQAKRDGTLEPELLAIMDAGGLLPDGAVTALIGRRTLDADCSKGFVLDGYPRTVPQAESLCSMLKERTAELAAVVQLDVPRGDLEERLIHRRTDKGSGQIYHLLYNPPPAELLQDPGLLEHRKDDQPQAVKARLDAYDSMTAALLPYYEKQGLLRRVDAVGKPEDVTGRIYAVLEEK